MDAEEYRARRARRGDLARRASREPEARREILANWRFGGRAELVDAVAPRVRLADCPEAETLVAWAFGPAPGLVQSRPRSELEFDRQVLGTVPAFVADAEDRAAAAWYLLARIGEEIRLRDTEVGRFPRHPHDEAAKALFADMFVGRFGMSTARTIRRLYAGSVKRAFAAVGTDLRLSQSYLEAKVEGALEVIEFLAYDGGWAEIAIRMIEGTDAPIVALARALDSEAGAVVSDCVAGRDGWGQSARALLGGIPGPADVGEHLAEGADLHVLMRLLEHFAVRVPSGTSVGLPGWLVVSQNRGKIRGRLRRVLARDPARLRAAVLGLEGFYARSEAAFARYAWDWAWREARLDFSFNPETLRPSACELPVREPPPPPAPPLRRESVRTTVLLLVARGVEDDLRKWVAGGGSTTLSDKFYRYLSQAPDSVADPGTRSRSYTRLRDHLEDSLDDYLDEVATVAGRVAEVSPSRRGMIAELHRALVPDWEVAEVPLPEHGSERIRECFVDFLRRRPGRAAAGGDA